MKKFLFILIVAFFLLIGTVFFTIGKVQSEISEFIKNENFEIVKQEFHQNFVNSNGFFEAIIKKEQIYKFIDKFDVERKIKKSSIDDIKFRYDYNVKHSFLNISKGFTTSGSVTFLDTNSKSIFKEATPIEIETKHNSSKSNIQIKIKNMLLDKNISNSSVSLKNLIITTNYNNKKEIEDARIDCDRLDFKDDEVDFFINNLSYIINLDKPMAFNDLSSKNLELTNFNSKITLDLFDNNKQPTLKNVAINSTLTNKNDIINYKIDLKADNAFFETAEFKNLDLLLNLQYSKDMVEDLYKNIEFGIYDDNKTFEIVAKNGINMDLEKFSIENLQNNIFKIDFKTNFKGVGNDFTKYEKADIAGNIDLNATFNEFVKDYDNSTLNVLSEFADTAILVMLDEKKSEYKANFRYDLKNEQIFINGEDVEEKIRLKNAINLAADMLEKAQSDIAVYYIANCKFANLQDILQHGYSEITQDTANLQISKKACIKISVFNTTYKKPFIKFEKGVDENEKECQAAYKDERIKEILTKNYGKFEMFGNCDFTNDNNATY